MYKDAETGIVLHNDEVCIGCKTCVNSCPYEAPQFDEDKNLIIKCDSCKGLRDAGQNPVCVDACAMRALDFGETDALMAKYSNALVREVPGLPSSDDTDPNLVIASRALEDASALREIRL